jgi:hypothetical protein
MKKSFISKLLYISFYIHIFIGVVGIFIDKPQNDFPPNMGWIIILGLLNLLDEKSN